MAGQTKWTQLRKDVPDYAASWFVPFVVETSSVQVAPLPYPLQMGILPLTYPLRVPLTLKTWEGLSVRGSY